MSDCRFTYDLDQHEHEEFMADMGLQCPELDADYLRDMHNEFDAETNLDLPMVYVELDAETQKEIDQENAEKNRRLMQVHSRNEAIFNRAYNRNSNSPQIVARAAQKAAEELLNTKL